MTKFKFVLLFVCLASVSWANVVPKRGSCRDPSERCYEKRIHPVKQHVTGFSAKSEELEPEYWFNKAKQFTEHQVKRDLNKNVAKNIIFFIGDGMSIPTISAARVYMGGEEQELSFDKFPSTGLSKTYCMDRMVPDSASTATALFSGVKTNYGVVGFNAQVPRKDCKAGLDETKKTPSVAKWAQDAGKVAGIVTTTRITDATPQANYAHSADRYWEANSELPENCDGNIDVATQLIHGDVGSKFKVMLGGGIRSFIRDDERDSDGKRGIRTDGRNLIDEWKKAGANRQFVDNRDGLLNVDANSTDSLLGLFQSSHMLYRLEAIATKVDEEKPRLEEMTRKAIEILQKNEKGFYLMVEGGKIDLAHHSSYAKVALNETAEFSKAIQTAVDMTNENDTLIVVTSDHSHTMTISGYPIRGNDIFGEADVSDMDNLPFLTLSYANGDGYYQYMNEQTNSRRPLTDVDSSYYKQKFPASIPKSSESHGGEDVAVFARGPWSHLFSGNYEQAVIPHLIAYAACVGNGLKACD